MGHMRFHAPEPESLLSEALDLAYVAGLEAVPWRSQNVFADGVLTISRSISESGNLYFNWLVPDVGRRVLSTCTLMERDEPYHLLAELARGTVHRARSLMAEMLALDTPVPSPAKQLVDEALPQLFQATTSVAADPVGAEAPARRAIALAAEAIELLAAQSTTCSLEQSLHDGENITTILGGSCDGSDVPRGEELADQFTSAFQAASLPIRWRDCQEDESSFEATAITNQVEWCKSRGLRVIAGPLIQLDELSLPDFAYGLAHDYEQFEAAAIQYVQSVVTRFRDRVDIWVCAGRLNVPSALELNEEQKLRLAVATLEAVRTHAPRSPVVISFDQPWAEYLATEDLDLSPLHFADALVRADLGVAGVGIEVNLGYWPQGSQPRDMLAISRHVDRWSLLGIPLLVYLRMPSSGAIDLQAIGEAGIVPYAPDQLDRPAVCQQSAAELVQLLLTKPSVHGIIWNQWSDAPVHEFPNSGLLDREGCPKPLLKSLSQLREKYLS